MTTPLNELTHGELSLICAHLMGIQVINILIDMDKRPYAVIALEHGDTSRYEPLEECERGNAQALNLVFAFNVSTSYSIDNGYTLAVSNEDKSITATANGSQPLETMLRAIVLANVGEHIDVNYFIHRALNLDEVA